MAAILQRRLLLPLPWQPIVALIMEVMVITIQRLTMTLPGGAYGWKQTAYGPYGSATRGAGYNPYTGTYVRGNSVLTPYGSRSAAQAYNPYTGTYAQTKQGSSLNAQWGSSYVSRGNQSATMGHYSTKNGTVAGAADSQGRKSGRFQAPSGATVRLGKHCQR